MIPGVLLDSNVYRGAADERFDAFLNSEKRRGVARYADPFVAMEFLAHLADPHDAEFKSCRRAIVRLHRRIAVVAGGECGMLDDTESRLAQFITGKVPRRHAEYTERTVLPLIQDIAQTPFDQPLPARMQQHLRIIADHVAEMEDSFSGQMREVQAIVAQVRTMGGREQGKANMQAARLTHESGGQRRMFAEIMIRHAHANAELPIPNLIPSALVDRMLDHAAVAIEFEALLWAKVAFDGANVSKDWVKNLRWDQRIAYNIGRSMRGHPLWLVTDDGDFGRAAKAAGHDGLVYTPRAYEQWLAR